MIMMIDSGIGDDKNHHDWLRFDLLCHICLSGHRHRCLLLPLQWIPSWSQPCQSSIWIDFGYLCSKRYLAVDEYLRDVCKLILNIAISFLTSQYSPSMATLSIPNMDRYLIWSWIQMHTYSTVDIWGYWPPLGKYDPHMIWCYRLWQVTTRSQKDKILNLLLSFLNTTSQEETSKGASSPYHMEMRVVGCGWFSIWCSTSTRAVCVPNRESLSKGSDVQ